MTDFYAQLKQVDNFVNSDPYDRDPISQREAIETSLQELGRQARILADDLRLHPPGEPSILYDGCEGEWEEFAYVPVSVASTPRQAIEAIPAKMVEWAAEDGMRLYCAERVWLAPSEWIEGDDYWNYSQCPPYFCGATEFWQVEITEPEFLPRRWRLERLLRLKP